MIAWRICRARHADLTGEGARLFGGRWNVPGLACVYMAEHPALALLEVLVHLDLDPDFLPVDYVLMTVSLLDDLATRSIDFDHPPSDQAGFGSRWLAERRGPVLWVPSVLLPQSYNILLNPNHPDAPRAEIKAIEPVTIDARLA